MHHYSRNEFTRPNCGCCQRQKDGMGKSRVVGRVRNRKAGRRYGKKAMRQQVKREIQKELE